MRPECAGGVGYNARAATMSRQRAKVAELVDAQDLGSCGETRESSSLSFRTMAQAGRRDPAGLEKLRN